MNDASPLKIFLSYRRGDSIDITAHIAEKLQERFGADRVFVDIEGIPGGADFPDLLQRELAGCGAVVAVIGKKWTAPRSGRPARIMDKDDWVRLELETALARGIPVMPVLVGGARVPVAAQLPESLGALCNLHALTVASGIDFKPHMSRLMDALARLMGEEPRRAVVDGGPSTIVGLANFGAGIGTTTTRRSRVPALQVPEYLTDSAPLAAGAGVLASLALIAGPAAETLLRGGDPATMGWFDQVIGIAAMAAPARVVIAALLAAVVMLLLVREKPIGRWFRLALMIGSGLAFAACVYLYFYTGPSFHQTAFDRFPTVERVVIAQSLGGDVEGARDGFYNPLRALVVFGLAWNLLALLALLKNKGPADFAIPATVPSNG